MSEELARYTPATGGLITEAGLRERRDLLQGMFGAKLNDAEFDLFAATSARLGLDPLSRQIYAMKYKDKRSGTDKMSIVVGIDGYRSIAVRTGEYAGQRGPFWCGEDGEWTDVWLKPTPPRACKVYVYRRGFQEPVCGVALWAEYAQTYQDGNPSGMWAKFPSQMLAKCAEAQGLRKAFPDHLSGVYTSEEMDQAQAEVVEVQAEVVQAKPIARPVSTKPSPAAASKLAEMKAILSELERLAPDDYDNIRQAGLKAKDNAEDFEDVLKGARRLLQTLKDAADELPM